MVRKAPDEYTCMPLTGIVPLQCKCIILPTLPPGSGSEADSFAGMPTVEVVVDKVMVDVVIGHANGVQYKVQVRSA